MGAYEPNHSCFARRAVCRNEGHRADDPWRVAEPYALATLRDETEPITVAARRLLDGFAAEDAVYIVTDVMGGSVNNEMLTLLPEYPAVHLICGMNASLVLTLASNDEALTQDELAECIADAKAQIIDCNLLLKNAAQDEEDDL